MSNFLVKYIILNIIDDIIKLHQIPKIYKSRPRIVQETLWTTNIELIMFGCELISSTPLSVPD